MAELSLRLGILIPSLVFLCLHNKNDYVCWAPDTIVSLYAAFLASTPHFQRLGRYRKRGRHPIQEGEKGHLDFSAHLDHDSVPRPGKARGEWGSCSGGQQAVAHELPLSWETKLGESQEPGFQDQSVTRANHCYFVPWFPNF